MINLGPFDLDDMVVELEKEHDNHISDIHPTDWPQARVVETYQEYVFDDYTVRVDENLYMDVWHSTYSSKDHLQAIEHPALYRFFDALVSDWRRDGARYFVEELKWQGKC